jgi:hypothetical protein
MMAWLLSKVLWMASCGGVCNGELLSSYYLDIVINSIVTGIQIGVWPNKGD